MESQNFYDFLRKDVDLSTKRYSYPSSKIGEGFITDSRREDE
jgi:hypothetical protein